MGGYAGNYRHLLSSAREHCSCFLATLQSHGCSQKANVSQCVSCVMDSVQAVPAQSTPVSPSPLACQSEALLAEKGQFQVCGDVWVVTYRAGTRPCG